MKTPEELNTLKEEVESLQKKLSELTDDELTQVTGGVELRPIPGYDIGVVKESNFVNPKPYIFPANPDYNPE
ncbi:MAG: bacteriocin [Eubacteriales bacterium]|nr:bacteriocin [Eubacteriales bacterium]